MVAVLHALINSCIAVTYSPNFLVCLVLLPRLCSALGVLRTTCVLRLCPDTPNYRTERAANTSNASRRND